MIRVPEAGVVTAVNTANGQYVNAGQALVTVALSHGLHLVANLYGNDASLVTSGMRGVFLAEGANALIDVVVQRASWSVARPGSWKSGSMPRGGPLW